MGVEGLLGDKGLGLKGFRGLGGSYTLNPKPWGLGPYGLKVLGVVVQGCGLLGFMDSDPELKIYGLAQDISMWEFPKIRGCLILGSL